jgi:glycyl-tRNA synthetase
MTDGADGTTLVELAKRRGFFLQSAGAYGGVSGFYTFGPQGAALKQAIEDTWRDRFTIREGNVEVDAPTVMPEAVFEASGHLDGFDDMLVECPDCGESHRADHVIEDGTDLEDAEALPVEEVEELIAEYELVCPNCGAGLAGQAVEDFNLMFATNIGPGDASPGYLRPETAQGIFIEFPQLAEYARNQLPFGVTQIGRAYRNEISPRKSLLRVREFTQAELELFIDPEEDEPDLGPVADVTAPFYPATEQAADDGEPYEATVGEMVDDGTIGKPWIAYYLGVAREWYERIGVDMDRFRFRQHLSGERAHYAADCWDAEAEVDGDWIELGGFAYRSDYDLSKHDEYSDDDFTVFTQYDEPITTEQALVDPDMSYLGPEFGGAAQDVADALANLAERNPAAFEDAGEDGEVTVEVDGEDHAIPVSQTDFRVEEVTESGEHITPHVVEPSLGIDRALYTVLDHTYRADEVDGEERAFLELPAEVAPTTVGVFPLMDRDGLGEKAQNVARELREAGLSVTYDDAGAIGRRYRRQDEVGTPFCITVDYTTLGEGRDDDDGEPGTVTVRERDTTAQRRIPLDALTETLTALRDGDLSFDDL